MVRIGIDTGGTFTDTILIENGSVHTVKTPTTPDLITGVLTGFATICDRAGITPGDVEQFSHGSTVALNAILEGTGAKTALITTAGFRDVLELREGHRDASLLYNPCGDRPWNPIPRRYRYEVRERTTTDGHIATPIDESDIDAAIDELQRHDIESVAVCLLHAHRNPTHEQRIADRLAERAPNVEVSLSSNISPEIREYSRTATTAVDALIRPIVNTYVTRLASSLTERGLDAPVTIMNSDGGIAHPAIASKRPITQLLSGPVGGVKAAQTIGSQLELADLITLDMGGTSCDAAIIDDGTPLEESHRTISGVKLNGPFVTIHTVGAGGGSIARTTHQSSLRVGPESAGASPGPACYGRGGRAPTVTDADLILGVLNPLDFAGGAFDLDVDAARTAITDAIADPLGMTLHDAARAIRNVIDTKLASAIRVVSMQNGHDPRDFALMGFGGAGPAHACAVGRELGTDTVVFPANPGLLSSLGLLVTDIQHNYVRSFVETIETSDRSQLEDILSDLIEQGSRELDTEGVDAGNREYAVSFDMMYYGQAHYLNIPYRTVTPPDAHKSPAVTFDDENATALADRFETTHDRQYGFVDVHNEIEIVNIRVTARGAIDTPQIAPIGGGDSVSNANQGSRTVVVDRDTSVDVPFYDWAALPPNAWIDTPAIIESSNTTMWLPPEDTAELDDQKNVIVHVGGSP